MGDRLEQITRLLEGLGDRQWEHIVVRFLGLCIVIRAGMGGGVAVGCPMVHRGDHSGLTFTAPS